MFVLSQYFASSNLPFSLINVQVTMSKICSGSEALSYCIQNLLKLCIIILYVLYVYFPILLKSFLVLDGVKCEELTLSEDNWKRGHFNIANAWILVTLNKTHSFQRVKSLQIFKGWKLENTELDIINYSGKSQNLPKITTENVY